MTRRSSARNSVSNSADVFISKARENELIQCIQADLKCIIQECYPDLDALVEEIEALGLPVILDGPEMQIKLSIMLVGGQLGFIAPTLPKYTEFVNSLKKLVPAKAHLDYSNGVLVALKEGGHFPFLAYNLYHYSAFINGLDGYQDRARKLFHIFNRKYEGQLNPKFLEKLDLEESQMLRTAIRRDKEALQFVRYILNEVFIPMNNARLLDKGEAQA